MPDLAALLLTLLAVAAFGALAIAAEGHYRQLPELTTEPIAPDRSSASVDVFIPARDEAPNMARVTASLLGQRYPTFQVTVIDDHSTDATAQIACAAGARLLRLEAEPPPGWTGKCNACDQAARRSSADWLLFTDADTCHAPGSLAAAVAYAEARDLDALSLLLRQECVGFWDRLVLPLAYEAFFAVLDPARPAFNGQYILIRRTVYERSGGFGAVRGRVMEDVALAEALTRQGYRIALINGHAAASVRMYADFGALLHGMTKTAFTAARDRGAAGWLLGSLTFLGVFVLAMGAWGLVRADGTAVIGAGLALAVNGLGALPWLRRFSVAPGYALLNGLGLAVLWRIGMIGTFRALAGRGVRWKGRTIVERR